MHMRLGLPWPKPTEKRGPGRPSRQLLYTDALYECIKKRTLPEDLYSAQMPMSWEKGGRILGEEERVTAGLRHAAEIPVTSTDDANHTETDQIIVVDEDEPEFDDGEPPASQVATQDEAGPVEPKAKRKKVTVPQVAKEWFLQFAERQTKRYGWGLMRCLRHVQEIAPEVFGDVHDDTPRRWKQPPAEERRGRPQKLPPIALTSAAEALQAVTAVLPIPACIAKEIIYEPLRVLDIEADLSITWVKQFMRQLNLSYKTSGGPADKHVDPELLADNQQKNAGEACVDMP